MLAVNASWTNRTVPLTGVVTAFTGGAKLCGADGESVVNAVAAEARPRMA